MRKSEFYNQVKAEIIRGNSGIKKVYRYRGQLNDPEQANPLVFPCILVEFEPIDYQATSTSQRGRGDVVFHVVTKCLSSEDTGDLDQTDLFHNSINRKFGLIRTSENPEYYGPITDWLITYHTNIFE